MYPVRAGDIVISNIAALYGSIAVVPQELDGCVVSNEYTGVRSEPNEITLGQHAQHSCSIPRQGDGGTGKGSLRKSEDAKKVAQQALQAAREQTETAMMLRSDDASLILAAFKPPK